LIFGDARADAQNTDVRDLAVDAGQVLSAEIGSRIGATGGATDGLGAQAPVAVVANGFGSAITSSDAVEHAKLAGSTLGIRDAALAQASGVNFLVGASFGEAVADQWIVVPVRASVAIGSGAFHAGAARVTHGFTLDVLTLVVISTGFAAVTRLIAARRREIEALAVLEASNAGVAVAVADARRRTVFVPQTLNAGIVADTTHQGSYRRTGRGVARAAPLIFCASGANRGFAAAAFGIGSASGAIVTCAVSVGQALDAEVGHCVADGRASRASAITGRGAGTRDSHFAARSGVRAQGAASTSSPAGVIAGRSWLSATLAVTSLTSAAAKRAWASESVFTPFYAVEGAIGGKPGGKAGCNQSGC